MTEFTIMLSDGDTDLLYSIKQQAGLGDLTGNEFARQILEAEIHRQARENLSTCGNIE
jgi:hypothetical protein